MPGGARVLTLELGIGLHRAVVEWCERPRRRLNEECRQCSTGSPASCIPDARVLYVTVAGAVIAGVFGSSVAQHLSPYGADDPATQSVQATNRFQAATRPRDRSRRSSRSSRGHAAQRPARRRVEPDRRPAPARPRRGQRRHVLRRPRPGDGLAGQELDLRPRVLQAQSDDNAAERRPADRGRLRRPARREARGRAVANAQVNTQVEPRPRARRAARVSVRVPALAPVLPHRGGRAAAPAARRAGDRRHVLHACGSSRASSTCRCSRST